MPKNLIDNTIGEVHVMTDDNVNYRLFIDIWCNDVGYLTVNGKIGSILNMDLARREPCIYNTNSVRNAIAIIKRYYKTKPMCNEGSVRSYRLLGKK